MSIAFHQCTKFYGNHKALDRVTFTVNAGEIFGFLGPNGAGKSTSIRILLGFIKASEGDASVYGLDAHTDSIKIRQMIGYLPGEIALPNSMSAMELIEFSLSIHKKDKTKALRLFDRFELPLQKRIKEMSKGMKQKLAIINAFCHDPAVYILDEPSSGLDPLMQSVFNELLMEEKQQGKTIFMSSHILSDVENICDRIAMIRKGKIEHIGILDDISSSLPYKVTMKANEECLLILKGERNISDLYFDGIQVHFRVSPPFTKMFAILSSCQIDRVIIQPPSLEEVFMHFYKGGESLASDINETKL